MGGRLCKSENLDFEVIHTVVLDPKNHITKLLVANFDSTLCHPVSQRVLFAGNTGF